MATLNSDVTIQALASQVGGHAGVMTTEDGSLLIKPALTRELAFYQRLQSDEDPAFAVLRKHTPKFLGTLTLEGKAAGEGEGGQLLVEPVGERKESLVLENLSHKFTLPNILDIKLGTVLYDETASEEKVQRMIKTAQETTSFETGVRLTGFQVHDNYTKLPVNTPKSYGKSIKPKDLPDGIARIFPVAAPSEDGSQPEEGRFGLPPKTLLPILTAIRGEIADIRAALANIEFRMVGGSLLVVYEANWEKAAEGIKKYLEDVAAAEAKKAAGHSAGEEDEDDEEDDDDDDDDDEESGPPPAFVVKLIDFAHTRVEAGLGPDEGVLVGVDTTLSLLDGRIQEIKEKFNL